MDIKSDKEVMEMLSATLGVSFNRMCSIYIVDWWKSTTGLEQILEHRSVGMCGEHVEERVLNKVEIVKNSKRVVENSNFDSATKTRKSTSVSKGKSVVQKSVENNVVQSVEKRVVERVSKDVVISFGKSGSEKVVKSSEKHGSETFSKNVSEVVSKTMTLSVDDNVDKAGNKSLSDSMEENMSASVEENFSDSVGKYMSHGVNTSASAKPTDQNIEEAVEKNMSGSVHEGVGSANEILGEGVYDSESDGSYIPSSEEETDDEMEADELVFEDEEYTQGRKKMKERKKAFVITDEMFQRIVNGGQKSDYVSEYENSEEDDIYSDSTDFEDEGRRSRQRHAKVVYDPKCDHKLLTFSAGIGFIDGHQARDALTDNAGLNG